MYLRDLSKLDLAFALDATGSMGPYIQNAKNNIERIADELKKSEKVDLRLALVNFRDHPPQDLTYVTEVHDLTNDINQAKQSIHKTSSSGGGDRPESVCCALNDCVSKLSWRDDAVKVVILITDAPPHGLGTLGDSLPGGCPDKVDPVEVAQRMAQKGITLYCAGCEPLISNFTQFYVALTLITGGAYVSLGSADQLANVIIGGAREEMSMEKLMADVHNEYMKEVAEKGARVDEDELTRRIHSMINSTKTVSDLAVKCPKSTIEITDSIKEMSKAANLEDLKLKATLNGVSFYHPNPYKHTTRKFEPTRLVIKKSTHTRKAAAPGVKRISKKRTRPVKRTMITRLAVSRLRRSLRLMEKNKQKLIFLF